MTKVHWPEALRREVLTEYANYLEALVSTSYINIRDFHRDMSEQTWTKSEVRGQSLVQRDTCAKSIFRLMQPAANSHPLPQLVQLHTEPMFGHNRDRKV